MAEFFVMPQASPTMTVGVVGKWVVAEGAALSPSQAIAQVETDKATMDIEVFDKGVLLKHLAAEGEEVPPGQPIAIIGKSADEDISALLAEFASIKASRSAPAATPAAATPAAAPPAAASAAAAPVAVPAALSPQVTPAPVVAAKPLGEPGKTVRPSWAGRALDDAFMEPRAAFRAPGPRVVASPLARAMAEESGISLARIRGSGAGGRIVAADVESASAGKSAAVRPADSAARTTQMRKTIARRLTDVHQQVPVFYLTASFDATGIVALKDAVGKRAEKGIGTKVSVNDVLIRCVAAALRDVPEVNAQWAGDQIIRKGGVDIGIAVALPEGLITPVIRDADQKSVSEISTEVRELAKAAKEGKLQPEQYTGGTFTISNLGMYEIEQFTAILNPPESAILAVGSALQVPAVVNGQVCAQWRMKVTMTCDHRVVDGALGARYLQALRAYVENPGLIGV